MAITQISKIQVRRGRYENLPTLSAGELGWAVDDQRLFIGNGTYEEGAPQLGNTELLTSNSNILEYTTSYNYNGERAGYIPNTGPTYRNLQSKLDQIVSVLDFGAKGDGSTDDSNAINLAMQQLYCEQTNLEIRRILFFPAGKYMVSSIINIPTYANLMGEGVESSIIHMYGSSSPYTAQTVDSTFEADSNIGIAPNSVPPKNIVITDMGFSNGDGNGAILITRCDNIKFNRTGFFGTKEFPASVSTDYGVQITSSAVMLSKNIQFSGCKFDGFSIPVYLDYDCYHVKFNNCQFSNGYYGFRIGENTGVASPKTAGPYGLSITDCLFDKIYSKGILSSEFTVGIISNRNTFLDVATNATGMIQENVIYFGNPECHSVLDFFKPTADPNIPFVFCGANLVAGTGSPTVAAAWPVVKYPTGKINYMISRSDGANVDYRSGLLNYAYAASSISVNYNDSNIGGNLGIALTVTTNGSDIQLKYTSTAGQPAILHIELS